MVAISYRRLILIGIALVLMGCIMGAIFSYTPSLFAQQGKIPSELTYTAIPLMNKGENDAFLAISSKGHIWYIWVSDHGKNHIIRSVGQIDQPEGDKW